MAKKKIAKKKVTKKKTPAKATAEPAVRKIRYRCSGILCRATPKFAHMSPGDVVVLLAIDTDATVNFVGASPFQSGTNPIHIPKGTAHPEVVGPGTGTFDYSLSCSACTGGTVVSPKMIVP